jgi:diadenosine tetraphosphatase ApaH/serine/threonine PP2A family protein phosphatase
MPVSVPSDSDVPALPKGQLLYAVGDIHGRLDLLRDLLQLIEDDAHARSQATRRTLVFLGDYVDRGPDSSGVVANLTARAFPGFDTHFLKGNHEAILLNFLGDPLHLDHWLVNGGQATMDSYGVDTRALAEERARPERWREAFAAALPETHLRFFRSLQLSVTIGDYLFVHAGVRPGVPLAAQSEDDLVWIRGPFLDHAGSFGKFVVHGHTPALLPVIRPNRIGIDTGAVFSDRLTALRLEDRARAFLHT